MFLLHALIATAYSSCLVCTPGEGYALMESDTITKTEAFELVSKIDDNMQAYAFRDIGKAPPQPEGHSDYYKAYNIDFEMDAIKLYIGAQIGDTVPFLTLFVKLSHVISGTRDLHSSLTFVSNPKNYKVASFFTVNPTSFYFQDKKVFLSVPLQIVGISPTFFFSEALMKNLTAKQAVEVTKINGVDATQFITNFAFRYFRLKNKNGAVTLFKHMFVLSLFAQIPFDEVDMFFTLTFADGSTINFTSMFFDMSSKHYSSDTLRQARDNLQKVFACKFSRNSTPITPLLSPLEIITNSDFTQARKKGDLYVYNLEGVIACGTRLLGLEIVNLLVVYSFQPNKVSDFTTVATNCAKLFDTNTSPIIIVLPMNGGGVLIAEEMLMKTLSPYLQSNQRYVARISNSTENTLRNGYGQKLLDPVTGKRRMPQSSFVFKGDMGEWYTKPERERYGEFEFVHTQSSFMEGEKDGYSMKNVRSPGEVVVFSDHFCYSACALFAVHLHEKKAAIFATYSGLQVSDFRDIGESPTAVIEDRLISNGKDKTLLDQGIKMEISFLPSLPADDSKTTPTEYIVHQPDEYVEIEKFEDTETSIHLFLKKGIEIYEKYKKACKEGTFVFSEKCKRVGKEVFGLKCVNSKFETDCEVVGCLDGYVLNNQGRCVSDITIIDESSSGVVGISVALVLVLLLAL